MILALKTADSTTQMVLCENPGSKAPLATHDWVSGRDLSDQLLRRIMAFLGEHNATLRHLRGIIIFSGPGSFTSLRIGHTTANALADGLNIPVVGAGGDDWLTAGRESLKTARPGVPALPLYGADANITKPKS